MSVTVTYQPKEFSFEATSDDGAVAKTIPVAFLKKVPGFEELDFSAPSEATSAATEKLAELFAQHDNTRDPASAVSNALLSAVSVSARKSAPAAQPA
jgi:hypothetical protein